MTPNADRPDKATDHRSDPSKHPRPSGANAHRVTAKEAFYIERAYTYYAVTGSVRPIGRGTFSDPAPCHEKSGIYRCSCGETWAGEGAKERMEQHLREVNGERELAGDGSGRVRDRLRREVEAAEIAGTILADEIEGAVDDAGLSPARVASDLRVLADHYETAPETIQGDGVVIAANGTLRVRVGQAWARTDVPQTRFAIMLRSAADVYEHGLDAVDTNA